MRYYVIIAVIFCLVFGCSPRPSRPLVEAVSIIIVPESRGMAQFEARRDGQIRGGHLSGDATPFVQQEDGRLPAAVTDSLWSLLAVLQDSLPVAAPASGRGYVQLQLTFVTGDPWVYAWPDSKTPPPPLRPVYDWMLAHRIGGW